MGHVKGTESFDSRSVYQVSVFAYFVHFGKGCGMGTFVVVFRDFTGTDVEVRMYGIDEGRLSYAGVARKQGNLVVEQLAEFVNARVVECRNTIARIADVGIEIDECVKIMQLVFIVTVGLVEDNAYGDVIRFGSSQKAVYEYGRRLGIVDGDNQKALVQIGCNDMRLF